VMGGEPAGVFIIWVPTCGSWTDCGRDGVGWFDMMDAVLQKGGALS